MSHQSFTMGAQNVTVTGTSAPNTITTLVVTGAMASFFSDRRLFAVHNRPRDERFIFVIAFFVGGIIAGFAFAYSSAELALMLSGVFKFMAAGVVLVAPVVVEKRENEVGLRQGQHREKKEVPSGGVV